MEVKSYFLAYLDDANVSDRCVILGVNATTKEEAHQKFLGYLRSVEKHQFSDWGEFERSGNFWKFTSEKRILDESLKEVTKILELHTEYEYLFSKEVFE